MQSALIKNNNPIVMPAVTPDQAVAAFNAYQDLANKITTKDDIQHIQGKDFKKKSFWRKCQRFFNLSVELVNERKEDQKGAYTYFVMYRATAPNGAYCEGDGACTSNEKGRLRSEHDTRATAHTRAKNRAIADLVAFGEVSAEEINGEHIEELVESDLVEVNKCDECGTTNQYHKKGCKLQPPQSMAEYDQKMATQDACQHEHTDIMKVKKEGKNKGKEFKKCLDCDKFLKFIDEEKV